MMVKSKLTPRHTHATVLYCTALYWTVLYCTVLYCTVLYCCTVRDSKLTRSLCIQLLEDLGSKIPDRNIEYNLPHKIEFELVLI